MYKDSLDCCYAVMEELEDLDCIMHNVRDLVEWVCKDKGDYYRIYANDFNQQYETHLKRNPEELMAMFAWFIKYVDSQIASKFAEYEMYASDILDQQFFEETAECIKEHTVNGNWITKEDCYECHNPDCPIWCELSSRPAF